MQLVLLWSVAISLIKEISGIPVIWMKQVDSKSSDDKLLEIMIVGHTKSHMVIPFGENNQLSAVGAWDSGQEQKQSLVSIRSLVDWVH